MSPAVATTLTAADWESWARRNVTVRNDGLELAIEPTLRAERLSLPAADIAVGPDRTRYSLDGDGIIRSHDARRSTTRRLWGPADGGVEDPQAIGVDGDRLAVLGADGSVTVVSTRRRQPVGTTATGVDKPVTVAPADDGWFLLDAVGAVRMLRPGGRSETLWEGFSDPRDMAVTATGACYVLDERTERRRVRKQAATGDHLDGRIPTGRRQLLHKRTADGVVDPDPFPLSSFETADGDSFVPNRVATAADAPVWLAGSADDRPVVAAVDPETRTVDVRHRFDDSCRLLRSPATDPETLYAAAGDDLIRLDPTERRCRDADGSSRGVAYRQFDAGESVQWHRIALESAQSGANTRLRVSYLATDDPTPLSPDLAAVTGLDDLPVDTVWELLSMEPAALAARDDGLTEAAAGEALDAGFEALTAAFEGRWQTIDAAPTDALLDDATGRYLVVRLELVGSVRTSPRVDSMRAVWPRESSIESLPELFQDDPGSKAFLERFLSVFDTAFDELEADMDSLTEHLDPAAAPPESLPWLADWIGADLQADWPTAAIRELLAAAPELSRQRGTAAGLRRLLGIYLRHLPAPETPPGDRLVPSDVAAGDALAGVDHGLCLLEPRDLDGTASAARAAYERHLPTQRSVAVYAGPFDDPDHRAAVERIVREETPAHVNTSVVDLDPTFRLGGDSFLGCNSRLGERHLELGSTSLGHTAVLE